MKGEELSVIEGGSAFDAACCRALKATSTNAEHTIVAAFVDVDHLGEINKRASHHLLGTILVRAFISILDTALQDTDNLLKPTIARIGGDEFCILSQPLKLEPSSAERACKMFCRNVQLIMQSELRSRVGVIHGQFQARHGFPSDGDLGLHRFEALLNEVPTTITAGIAAVTREPADTWARGPVLCSKALRLADRVCRVAKALKRGTLLQLSSDIWTFSLGTEAKPVGVSFATHVQACSHAELKTRERSVIGASQIRITADGPAWHYVPDAAALALDQGHFDTISWMPPPVLAESGSRADLLIHAVHGKLSAPGPLGMTKEMAKSLSLEFRKILTIHPGLRLNASLHTLVGSRWEECADRWRVWSRDTPLVETEVLALSPI
jgi:GGDEF domain-containing protein